MQRFRAMLFNSYLFLFLFLPAAFAGFYLVGRWRAEAARLWLTAASLVFYAVNGLPCTTLLLASAVANYCAGQILATARRRGLLTLAVAANLAVLGWFKYAGFLAAPLLPWLGMPDGALRQVLPVGISFFTFTQIGYLVDAAAGRAGRARFGDYLLFVTWFPHLVAGPLLHHGQTMAQIRDPALTRPRLDAVVAGLAVFLIGLAKKTLLADAIAPAADAAFAPAGVATLGSVAAWTGLLAYTFQIYFDFSGYSDMAIGLSRLFNIRLPVNFDSPYQATSAIDFWRRWHISLSGFLRAHVYIPLGGNRAGPRRQYGNLMATMLLAGLWHGAGLTFVAWGAWHGALLVVNHLWRGRFRLPALAGWALTFLGATLGWVLFRAANISVAQDFYAALLGLHGGGALPGRLPLLLLPGLAAIAFLLPNSGQLLRGEALALPLPAPAPALLGLRFSPGARWAFACAVLFFLSLMQMTRVSPFLYYQF
jgi:D-alanyl-lipoteichoic acid acyltransferase DltB (MBOAT superfamily)